MRKLTLLFSSFLGSITGLFSQDISPFIEVPDSLNPFLNVEPNRLVIGDITGDGNDDIIFYDSNLGDFRHFVDSGNGQVQEVNPVNSPISPLFEAVLDFFQSPVSLPLTDLFFADVDSDGDSDVVFEIYNGSQGCDKYNYVQGLLIFENNGNGAFNTNPGEEIVLFSECASRLRVRFIDVDNDGDFDILQETGVYFYDKYYPSFEIDYELHNFNALSEEFENAGEVEGAAFIGEIYDINNDGFDDIVTRNEIRLNTGSDLNLDQLPDLSIADEIFPFNLNSSEFNNFLFGLGNFDNDQFIEIVAWSSNLGKWRLFSQNCALADGTSCNIEEDCIVNGTLQDCNCIGEISPDSDGDGFCDAIDQCPGADDNIDSDQDGIPDCIDQTNGDCTLNEPCDDGDACTLFESLDENCNCVGEPFFPDSDGDGICNPEDICPGQNDNIDNNQNGIPDCLEIQNGADFEEYGEDVPTGIDEQIELQRQIQIFPNPSSGIFTIQSHLKIEDIRLFTNLGKEIPLFITDQKQIDLGLFSNGIYIIELRTEAGILRKKIAKQ